MVTKEEIESKFKQKAGTITIERSSPTLDGGWRSEYFRQIKLFKQTIDGHYYRDTIFLVNVNVITTMHVETSFRMSVHDPLRWK